MIKIISNDQNFKTEIDWLISYHHFSFGEHYHPDKTNFGPLRVFNDDIIQPDMGLDFISIKTWRSSPMSHKEY